MSKDVKRDLDKACRIKRSLIEHNENNCREAGKEYLVSVRYATFICLRYGENSNAYKKSLEVTKRKLANYMRALAKLYDAQNLDVKDYM